MSELDPRLERALEDLRQAPATSPEARRRLSDAVREQELRLRGSPAPRAARVFVLTPLGAAGWAAALVLLTSAAWLGAWWTQATTMPPHPAQTTSPAAARQLRAGRVPVQFVLLARDAGRVSVVGDFNDWTPSATPLTRGRDGLWSAVVALPQGRYAYSYLVDGKEWRADPAAPIRIDDYGRPSSYVLVSGQETVQ